MISKTEAHFLLGVGSARPSDAHILREWLLFEVILGSDEAGEGHDVGDGADVRFLRHGIVSMDSLKPRPLLSLESSRSLAAMPPFLGVRSPGTRLFESVHNLPIKSVPILLIPVGDGFSARNNP